MAFEADFGVTGDEGLSNPTLARFSLAALIVYFPIETWVSLPYGLWHPMYLVDFIAMCLLAFGGIYSLRSRPDPAPGPLCAAYGWASANAWRATAWRWIDVFETGGEKLDRGMLEVWVVTVAAVLALGLFALSLVLVVRSRARPAVGD